MSQVLEALARANEIRVTGASVRREIATLPTREGRDRAAALLIDPPDAIRGMRIEYFLSSINRFGRVKTADLLKALVINPRRIIGPDYAKRYPRAALTTRQRLLIATELRRRPK